MFRIIILSICALLAAQSVNGDYRILAFGDSNTWGWIPMGGGARYPDAVRWTGVLEAKLGTRYSVVSDGLVARRSDIDGLDVGLISGSFLNGAKTLPPAIARNAPLNLVILFLGTNDLQAGAERSAGEIAAAVAKLAGLVQQSSQLLYSKYPAPAEVLIIVPPRLRDLGASPLKGLFEVGFEASRDLEAAFAALPSVEGVRLLYFDRISQGGIGADGIHLNEAGHSALAATIANQLKPE